MILRRNPAPQPSAGSASSPTERFQFALVQAKRWLASTRGPDGSLREGTNRVLAQEMKVSPGRIGDFLKTDFKVGLSDGEHGPPFSDARAKKAISGFAASVRRTAEWLKEHRFLAEGREQDRSVPEDALKAIVEGYWPSGHFKFNSPFVQTALKAGFESVDPNAIQRSRIVVNINVLPWGPFGDGTIGQEPRGFIKEYGKMLLDGIDPIDAEPAFTTKHFSEVLELEPRSQKAGWTITLGLYETLFRCFKGYRFVTFPIRIPLVALRIVSSRSTEQETLFSGNERQFEKLFIKFLGPTATFDDQVHVVKLEVGHLFVGSFLDRSQIHAFETDDSPEQIALKLRKEAIAQGEAIFVTDGILALEVFAQLSILSGIKAYPIGQEKNRKHEISYRIGFMLREEDRDLCNLLDASQHELFQTRWRAKRLFEIFLNGIKDWFEKTEQDEPWREAIFLVRKSDLQMEAFDDDWWNEIRDSIDASAKRISHQLPGFRELFEIEDIELKDAAE